MTNFFFDNLIAKFFLKVVSKILRLQVYFFSRPYERRTFFWNLGLLLSQLAIIQSIFQFRKLIFIFFIFLFFLLSFDFPFHLKNFHCFKGKENTQRNKHKIYNFQQLDVIIYYILTNDLLSINKLVCSVQIHT